MDLVNFVGGNFVCRRRYNRLCCGGVKTAEVRELTVSRESESVAIRMEPALGGGKKGFNWRTSVKVLDPVEGGT